MKSFEDIAVEMRRLQMPLPVERIEIKVPGAREWLSEAFNYFLRVEKREMQWLPEYDKVADWLTDNKGKGIFLYGNCGRGKSILCRYVLPAILLGCCRRVASVYDTYGMNSNIDHVLSKHIISLDDVGTEEVSNIYGNKRLAFAEIMDAAEKYSKLMIVSTNLSVDDIRKRYGDRVLDRIKSTTVRVLFEGESLR
ncbi:hypothetical protein [Prevotella sp. 10(H)]|uniref:hypothetical protein n=1 Tax=Prevotella sp. 10(H) TaxID=1158294 RepID=UPI0004A70458|nr:hypothetical protein [Prevotella sp. 10(H)]